MPLLTVSTADIPVLHSAEVCTLYPRVVIHSRKRSLQGFQTGSSSIPSPSEVSLPSITRLKYSRFTPCQEPPLEPVGTGPGPSAHTTTLLGHTGRTPTY